MAKLKTATDIALDKARPLMGSVQKAMSRATDPTKLSELIGKVHFGQPKAAAKAADEAFDSILEVMTSKSINAIPSPYETSSITTQSEGAMESLALTGKEAAALKAAAKKNPLTVLGKIGEWISKHQKTTAAAFVLSDLAIWFLNKRASIEHDFTMEKLQMEMAQQLDETSQQLNVEDVKTQMAQADYMRALGIDPSQSMEIPGMIQGGMQPPQMQPPQMQSPVTNLNPNQDINPRTGRVTI